MPGVQWELAKGDLELAGNALGGSPEDDQDLSKVRRRLLGRSSGNYLKNIEVLKQVVERGEEATTSLEGLSYPKS
ncbi:hypothetical protein B296_00032997 [Ensete ventricosum]|uniref:Uncharacterized protein n=1 Tax=Ensete ventricosum TaxID=4639 RepID=A0A426ZP30_ENSVE|nr:hypothetical protein B296_00032997 [Ensete ventricosum]